MTKEEQKIWKEGYDMGFRHALEQKSSEIKIGETILEVLDNRYEFAR